MNYKWNYEEPTPEQKAAAAKLSQEISVSETLCLLLVKRGITTADEARAYFRPQLQALHDPFLMRDMDRAVDRLNQAMGNRERVMIYGDYDVDGCTAVALVYRFLQQFYSELDYYIPDRYEEGYGVSIQGVDYAHETGVKLIIVLDCGIKAIEEIAYAKSLGIDFIICDHHVPDEELPPAVAILNAKRKDATYPYKDLSGCGVGFKFMQAFAISNGIAFSQLIPLLDLVAVSIASDIVPIMGENRILAYHGLRQLSQNPSVGMKAVIDMCGMSGRDITMSDIIFKIGPRINASGRMQNGKASVSLLVERNYQKALEQAQQINQYNEERKELDKKMTEEAQELVKNSPDMENKSSIVIYNEDWHKGVIGIVASRLTETFYRPAVVLTRSDDLVTGSARSVSGFDVYKAIQSCADLMVNFGGHTYAAGLSLKVEDVAEFKQRFETYVAENIESETVTPNIDVDAMISFSEINRKFYSDLKRMRPFGPENEKPKFCTKQVYDFGTSKVVGHNQEHIKLELVDNTSNQVMNGIAFGQSSEARYIKTKHSFDIVFTIEENSYRKGELQLIIEDIRAKE
ncbi:MAG: single-stranded-DNA-specific exonuclease RecJ [Bacteroidaceae bacterium]|jgi:single-stranded-DNA-specific exonuclease|nr:single-stranded-DNA-specific exonuclease RecJ [Bacteroidaceae bacterium]MBQ2166836.1 single-stranded-DNA-specific exonuclease RecJ [Bacteroidaceae bacterium]MBQ2199891.1 single-stranded-DNA-specific exonuclease RecJ [Bacteroidaceae bacterium]MBQ2586438.1 single-stranded-DNA-specific exonuclease RecJ [Bacteroidaceae bacterium]MBQ3627789.1 single-stranded-DNA-specific exonuclease RecJ [Bacteroidaceae bacterium]